MKLLIITIMLIVISKIFCFQLYASEDSLYDFLWLDPDKKVYVLQNKVFKKKRHFYADIGYILALNSKFQDTTGIDLSGGYYFTEVFALELFFKKYSNSNNDTFKSIQTVNDSEPFVRRPEQITGIMAIWSPFYGKINTFNRIYYFDWSFGLGFAKLNAADNGDTVADDATKTTYVEKNYTALVTKSTLRFHISRQMHLHLTLFNTHYNATGPKINGQESSKSNRADYNSIFGIGLSF